MKIKIKQAALLIVMGMTGYCEVAKAQAIYKTTHTTGNKMKLSGTSTLHKWTMNTRTFGGDAQFIFAPGSNTQLVSLKSLNFSLPVLTLKSGKKELDKNAYKALNTTQYKNISYKLTSAQVMPPTGSKYLVKTQGNLSISGVTKQIDMDVYCVVNKDATVSCTGSDNLKMTDYGVKPPTFMMGSMSTGDNIQLDFSLAYKK